MGSAAPSAAADYADPAAAAEGLHPASAVETHAKVGIAGREYVCAMAFGTHPCADDRAGRLLAFRDVLAHVAIVPETGKRALVVEASANLLGALVGLALASLGKTQGAASVFRALNVDESENLAGAPSELVGGLVLLPGRSFAFRRENRRGGSQNDCSRNRCFEDFADYSSNGHCRLLVFVCGYDTKNPRPQTATLCLWAEFAKANAKFKAFTFANGIVPSPSPATPKEVELPAPPPHRSSHPPAATATSHTQVSRLRPDRTFKAYPCGQHVELAALRLEEARQVLVVENIPDLVHIAIEGIPNIVSLCNESSLKIVPCFVLPARQNLMRIFS